MSFLVADRVKESSSTTGTGALTLSGAASNYQTFNTAIGVNNFCWYCVNSLSANEWEVGYGQLTGATTLTRIAVTSGTNGTSFVNFSAGTKEVFVTQPSAFNAQTLGRTNMIINPHGAIQQESTTPVTVVNGNYFADQWQCFKVASTGVLQAGVTTGTVSSYDPSYMFIKTTTAQGSLAASDNSGLLTPIEGSYIRRLLYGTSAAKTSWLRFRASCTQSATCSVAIRNNATDRSWVQSFAVTTTPTDFFFLIPGDTTGTWPTDIGRGANITFAHSSGTTFQTATLGSWQAGSFIAANTQTNLMGTLNAQLNVTDVQWTDSRVLLPFEPIDYTEELLKCQRYFITIPALGATSPFGAGQAISTTQGIYMIPFVQQVRSSFTATISSVSDFQITNSTGGSHTCTGFSALGANVTALNATFNIGTASLTAGIGSLLIAANANAKVFINSRM